MAEITGAEIKQMFSQNERETAHALAATLRDFGYPDVTDEDVLHRVRHLLGGGKAADIIDKFLAGWLENGIS